MNTGTGFASSSVSEHLLRGAVAIIAIVTALHFAAAGNWWAAPASLGFGVVSLVMMRGCPVCWSIGLIETIHKRREAWSGMPSPQIRHKGE